MATVTNTIRGQAQSLNSNQKPKSEYMLLIGTKVLNEATDEYEFISLPQPVGIDTMQAANVSGEGDFQELLCKRNDLLEQLLAFAKDELNPGDERELELTVKIYRRKASQAVKHSKVTFNFVKKE